MLKIFVIVCSVFLFIGGPDYYSPRSFKHLWDLGHIAFFAALCTVILLDWSKNKKLSFLRQGIAVILISLILGTLIEVAQSGTHRTADIYDVARDLVGTFVALFFFAPANKTVPKSLLRALQIISISMLIFCIFSFFKSRCR